ncbi:MAG: DUF2345 domain-containing protein, partial [Firmicutes bacterium]|nr:DUF2345 domain-containing protein [Bacillota bacterium]
MTEGINYDVTEEDVITNMFARLESLAEMRALYANDAAAAAYDSEISYIKQELLSLGYAEQHGASIVPVKNLKARYINVDDVEARGGNVHVEADSLTGTGHLSAPNDTSITITNNSMNFLRVNNLSIDPTGGHVYFNKAAVTSADDINERNQPGSPKAHLNIVAAGSSSAAPTVVVRNTYSAPGDDFVPPDIELMGDIVNRTGSVDITNVQGSIKLLGQDGKAAPSITADTLLIDAGRDIVQSYVDGFQHIGGDPRSIWSDIQNGSERSKQNTSNGSYRAGTGSWIAGNNVFLSARYLNINGTIQSGIPDWTLALDGSLNSQMDAYYSDWVRRGRPSMSDPHNLSLYKLTGNNAGEITAYYDPELDQIVLDGVKVQGGYIELFGQMMNTGGGNIKVLDGYGRIDIDNMTSRDIVINGIDTGGIDGIVRITDTGRIVGGSPIITEYTRLGGNVHRSEYIRMGDGSTIPVSDPASQAGRTFTYNPASGLRYVWMRGQDCMETYVGISEQKSTFWGALPISHDQYNTWEKTATGALRDLPAGVFTDRSGQTHNYEYYFRNYVTSGLKRVSREEWVTYHWADIIKSTPTYHLRDTWKQGSQDIHVHSLKADHSIPVEFIGYDEGRVDVNSNGSILLAGAVRNLGGDVGLRTDSSILRLTDRAVITGNDIKLTAGSGIGDNLTGVAVQLQGDGSLMAATNQGDINIYGTTGDLRLDAISAANGNVHINADLDIVQASPGTSPVITGNQINLVSRAGGIGTAGQAVNVQVGNTALSGLNATSLGDISIRQASGDLRLVRVESLGGDVTLEVASGSMIDANPEEKKDTRVIEELERLWDEMMLTEDTAGSSSEATLKAYRQAKEAEYQNYWRMRNVQPAFDEEGSVTGYTFDDYDPLHPNGEYQRLHEEYGDTPYDAAWHYTIGDEELAALTEGSVWTAKELETSLSRGLLFKQTTS